MADKELLCEVFEANLHVANPYGRPEIHYELWTDLPDGTLVALGCYRNYTNWRNESCVWVMVQDALTVVPNIKGDYNGVAGVIDVVKGDLEAKEEFEELLRGSAGIRTPVGDEIEVIFTVGARQRLKAFGKNNQNLVGRLIQERGPIHFIELKAIVNAPMRRDLQPLKTEGEE
jgi:hypothetical protein